MAAQCCPTCGRNLPKPRAVQVQAVNLSDLTTAELYAYYKRTALIEDLRFLLRVRLSPALRARIELTLSTKPTTADTRLMFTLWRIERQAEEREIGIPAIGSSTWHSAEQITADEDPNEGEELTQIAS